MTKNWTTSFSIPFAIRPCLPVGVILLLACMAVGVFGRISIGKAETVPVAAHDEAVQALTFDFPLAAVQESPVICLDPGHGGEDPGSILNEGDVITRREKDDNLRLALATQQELEKLGFKVILTREGDSYLETDARAKRANDEQADLLISLHRNIYNGTQKASGIEAWIAHDRPESAERLCTLIMNQFEQLGYMDLRSIGSGTMMNPDNDYIINGESAMTSCILEMGFLSSAYDNEQFDQHYNEYAKAIALAVQAYVEPER